MTEPPTPPASHAATLAWLAVARARLRGRVTRTGLPAVLAAGLMTVLVLLLLLGAVGGGSVSRWAAWAALTGLMFEATRRWLVTPWRATRSDANVARAVEAVAPEFKDSLLAVVQLAPEVGRGASSQDPELVSALSDGVLARARSLDLDARLPRWPSRRPLQALAAACAFSALMAAGFPDTLRAGLAALWPSRTLEGARQVGPLVGDLELTLVYPEHTQRPPRVVPNGTGDFEAPKGTRVRLRATTLAPSSAVWLRFGDAQTAGDTSLPLTLEGGREVTGEWTVRAGGVWRFGVDTEDQGTLVEGFDRKVTLEIDAPPSVTLKLPAEDVEVDDLGALRVEWSASDDYGLSAARVLVALASDAERPEKLEQPAVSGRAVEGHDEVDFRRLGAKPGDKFEITVEVFDNDSVDGPKRGVSSTRVVTFRSPDSEHQAITAALNALVDPLVTNLADRLEIDLRDASAPGPQARASAYQSSTAQAAATLSGLVARMANDPLMPKDVRLALAGRLGALERTLTEERGALERQGAALASGAEPAVRAVARANDAVVEQVEQLIILLEAMVARLGLEELMALTDELKASKDRIRGLMETFKATRDPTLKAQIMRDLARLKARIGEIRERLAKLRQDVPEEFLNADGLRNDEVGKGLEQTEDQLDRMQKMLEEGRVDEAIAEMEALSKTLDEMSSQLDEDMASLHKESDPAMQRALSELMDQTRDLIQRQEALAQQTEAQAGEDEDCVQRLLTEDLARPIAAVRERVARYKQAIDAVPASMSNPPDELALRCAEEMGCANDILTALERPDFGEAVERVERCDKPFRFADFWSAYAPYVGQPGFMRAVYGVRALNAELSRELSGLRAEFETLRRQKCATPPPPPPQQQAGTPGQPTPSPGQLGERQRRLAEETQRLAERMASQGEQMPGLGEAPIEQARKAAQQMGGAAGELDGQRPGQASHQQRQAISDLQGLMEGLKQAASPKRADRGNREGGRGARKDKVEIPGAEDHEAPAEFRKDLLEAMKDKAPETYEQQVKRYYESLVE
jgi:hypothetical protein